MKRSSTNFRVLFAVATVVFALALQLNSATAKDDAKSGYISEVLGQLDRVKG
jgi:hypothetical protein